MFSEKGTKSNLLACFFPQHFRIYICFAMDKDSFCDWVKSFSLSIFGELMKGGVVGS